jgi:hypothetical protein
MKINGLEIAYCLNRIEDSYKEVNISFNQLLRIIEQIYDKTGRDLILIGSLLKTIFTRIKKYGPPNYSLINGKMSLDKAIELEKYGGVFNMTLAKVAFQELEKLTSKKIIKKII